MKHQWSQYSIIPLFHYSNCERSELSSLLRFIARFAGYSAFNGLLIYAQDPSATFVATARSWKQKFGRQPKIDARPIVIWWTERQVLNINGEQIEADAAAYLTCKRLGLQASSAKHLANYIEQNHELPVFSLNAVLQSVGYLEEMGKSRWKVPKRRRRQ